MNPLLETHNMTACSNPHRYASDAQILAVLPGRVHDLARLRLLLTPDRAPVVTVIGKYNHGKSRLLNELMGQQVFAVADKRETVALAEYACDGISWLDAPGLDADVGAVDDSHALQATWIRSDIRLFVHAAKEGELDASERTLLHLLYADEQRSHRQTLLLLSQVDQLADEAQLSQVMQAIGQQFTQWKLWPVSSSRYRQGLDAGKKLLVERSGIPLLQLALQQAVARVPEARAHEAAWLLGEMHNQLWQLLEVRYALRAGLRAQQQRQRQQFEDALACVLDKVAGDIQAVLEVPGPDHSLTPDSFANQFKITPGKLERNRLQVAYSKACIEIGAVLARHGANQLPLEQRTSVGSLDHVMVAVMGISVKYRQDLRRIFCEASGLQRIQRAFVRYFELSPDREELLLCIAEVETGIRMAQQAKDALDAMKPLGGIE